jgi:4-hydroxybenzoate polyprenyltransferase
MHPHPDPLPEGEGDLRMRSLLILIRVSRPAMWPLLPLVYLLGLGAAGAELSAAAVAQAVLLTLPMNLVGCGLNDIYDYDADRRAARGWLIRGAVVGPAERPVVWRGVLVMIPLVVLGTLVTGNSDNFVATVCLVLLAWGYSVPPLRLKERPPLDSLANGLGYFYLPFVMGYSLGADPRAMPLKYYLLALCVCGAHALTTAADYAADRAAGQRTLAVVYGRRTAAAAAFAAFLVTLLLSDFHGVAVRAFLAVSVVVTAVATLVPRPGPIAAACGIMFVAFPIAAVCHIVGWLIGRVTTRGALRAQRPPHESRHENVGVVPRLGTQELHVRTGRADERTQQPSHLNSNQDVHACPTP